MKVASPKAARSLDIWITFSIFSTDDGCPESNGHYSTILTFATLLGYIYFMFLDNDQCS